MAPIKQRRMLLIAAETTAGTAANVSGGAIFSYDPIIQPDIPMDQRDATGYSSMLAAVPGQYGGTAEFSVEIAGSGSAAVPAWAQLLLGCGMSNNASGSTFVPTSNVSLMKTFTIATIQQGPTTGLQKMIVGAMGNFSIEATTGKRLMGKFKFSGVWQPPTDIAVPAYPALPGQPPRFANATYTIGGFAAQPSKWSVDLGNTIHLIETPNNAAALAYGVVTARNVTGSMDPVATNVAGYDWYGKLIAPSTAALSLAVGSDATGGIITITAPAVQETAVTEADRGKLSTNEIKMMYAPSAGDDELSIAFSY